MKPVVVFRGPNGQLLTVRATNLNILDFNASAEPKVLVSLLCVWVS